MLSLDKLAVMMIAIAVGSAVSLPKSSSAGAPDRPPEVANRVRVPPPYLFNIENPEDQAALSEHIAAVRLDVRDRIAELKFLRDKKCGDKWPIGFNHQAAGALAELRVEENLSYLIRFAAAEDQPLIEYHLGPHQEFPNMLALAGYGPRAVPEILEYVRQVPPEKITEADIRALAYAVLHIYGLDSAGRTLALKSLDVLRPKVDQPNADRLRHLVATLSFPPVRLR